jgi:hypothetical protein
MYTYIIKSGEYYKIGKTIDPNKRFSQYNTHNPDYNIVKLIKGNCEKYLHKIYKHKHSHLEFYHLAAEDINSIDEYSIPVYMNQSSSQDTIKLFFIGEIHNSLHTILRTLLDNRLIKERTYTTLLRKNYQYYYIKQSGEPIFRHVNRDNPFILIDYIPTNRRVIIEEYDEFIPPCIE